VYLKTLEIQGFKSFPEKTVIEFHQGITAIVGPNGSGKSNVTDAIRWVLGEQSVKALRGSKMEDVIFTGTQTRRAMGYSEVTIVIDNSDGIAEIDYTEIAVTRKLYRSGESEYFLNKSPCRLKDILTLFMDTGLGRDGYSIVGQGRVDEILSNKSEDRRKVFEEASGIVKYKIRKEESERKLDNTQQNLIRINDVIGELERQIEPLKMQSTIAKRYLVLRDELKSVEVALFLDNIEKFTQKYAEYCEEYDAVAYEIEKATFHLESVKSQNRQYTEQAKSYETELENKRLLLDEITDQIKQIHADIQINHERIQQQRLRIEAMEKEGDLSGSAIEKIDEELRGKKEKENYLNDQLIVYREKLAEYETQMLELMKTLGETERKAESQKERIDELTENLYEKKSQAQLTRAQNSMIETRVKTLESDIGNLVSEKDSLSIENEECEETLSRITHTITENCSLHEQCQSELETAKKECADIALQLETRKLDLENLRYRIQTLSELEKNREGYGEAVKAIMDRAGKDPLFSEGIRGTVGELIRVAGEFETAIEIALGGAIQNIITDHEKTASRLIDFLKQNRFGRATFLPIASVSGKTLESTAIAKLKKMPGFVDIACNVVEYDPKLKDIATQLLGRIAVVDCIEHAISIATQFHYGFKIVTLEGDMINPGGSLSGGYYKSKGKGILGRAREIEQLTQKSVETEKEIRTFSESLSVSEVILKEKASCLRNIESEATQISHEKIREEAKKARIEKDLNRCAGRITMLRTEQEQLEKQKLQINIEADALEQEAQSVDSEIATLKSELDKIWVSGKEEQEQRDELREIISDMKLSVHSVEESLTSAKEMTARIESEKQSHIRNINRQQSEQTRSDQEIKQLETQNESCQNTLANKTTKKEQMLLEIEGLTAQKHSLDNQMTEFYEQFDQISGSIGLLQTDLGKAEVKKGRMETALDEVKNKLWEQYELTYDSAQKWKADTSQLGISPKKVNELKTAISELGDISINSIEEYDKVSERYDFMGKQRDDIEESRQKLLYIIRDITDEMKVRFIEHFKVINENFKEVFSELFGGGMAEIILGDSDDVLNCNIDIHAQPPGKKLQNMLLLSGGERCLTAIALLFSILKLRPSPFCVLDEIEAALDDANIVRFNEYIRNYSDKSQFILVTHRKGTMEAADRLYGVTMQERGISRIFSMQLSD
jgi:chromosome segregation protein